MFLRGRDAGMVRYRMAGYAVAICTRLHFFMNALNWPVCKCLQMDSGN